MLYSTHGMLKALTGLEELEIDRDEAKTLAEAAAMVGRHYDMAVPEKVVDWYNLMAVAGAVYGPRIMVMGRRRRQPTNQNAAPQPAPAPVKPVVVANPPNKPANSGVIEIPGVGSIRRTDVN